MSSNAPISNATTQQTLGSATIEGATGSPSRTNGEATSGSSALPNPRSCVTCRRRKVRCDKQNPCNNCVKAGIDCVFPGPGRAPRKPRKPQDTELLARLRRLENVVQTLGAQVEDETSAPAPAGKKSLTAPVARLNTAPKQLDECDLNRTAEKAPEKEFGRLVIEEGKSRYLNHSFWTNLGDEVADIRTLLDESESEEDEYTSPDQSGGSSSTTSNHQAFVFGYSAAAGTLRNLHPTPTQVFILWRVYKEQVDPVVKIFHRSIISKELVGAATSIDNLAKVPEAVLFSIYFAAVTSLTPTQCRHLFNEDRDTLISKYRFATEQALARAGFLTSSSLMLLQAFVLFLICVRRHDHTRFVWSMVGVALRTAVALGVHRDGTKFGLSPFETEMRRRLWWHIVILDPCSYEDHGVDPSIFDPFSDTQLPLNINDEDIRPEMTELPAERKECTDMTFGLIRFEINSTSRRLLFTPPGTSICAQRAKSRTIEEKEQILDALRERLQERYFQNCDVTVPMDWVVVTVGKLILSKLWLMIHHPLQREDRGKGMSSDIRDRLFITSTEVIEFTRLLETNENTAKWGWLFHTHVQWHAVAYLLTELAIRGPSPEVDRAWAAVDVFNNTWVQEGSKSKSNIFWRPIKALMARAMAVREQQNQTKATQWMSDIQHGSSSTTISPTQQVASGITSNPGSLLGNTSPLDSIGQTALAFGMDLDIRDMYQNSSSGGFSSNIQVPQTISHPQEMTPAQRNLSDEDINQWLVTEPMPQVTSGQQNINFDWQGWDAIASDFQMGGTDGTAPSIFQYTDLL